MSLEGKSCSSTLDDRFLDEAFVIVGVHQDSDERCRHINSLARLDAAGARRGAAVLAQQDERRRARQYK